MRKRDSLRALCDEIWDELFASIAEATCLRRHEKSVLAYLWTRCKTRSLTCHDYPGHEEAGAALGVSPLAAHAALVGLERKGFVRAVRSTGRRKATSYRLNAFMLECAYDKVRLKKTS